MRKPIRDIILIFVLTLPTKLIFGQNNCNDARLLGQWTMLDNFIFDGVLNLESLVQSMANATTTISVWTFHYNGTYVLQANKRKSKGHFKFLSQRCEIRLGKRSKTPEGLIFNILLIDKNYLIMKCTKPKGDFLYLCRRT